MKNKYQIKLSDEPKEILLSTNNTRDHSTIQNDTNNMDNHSIQTKNYHRQTYRAYNAVMRFKKCNDLNISS